MRYSGVADGNAEYDIGNDIAASRFGPHGSGDESGFFISVLYSGQCAYSPFRHMFRNAIPRYGCRGEESALIFLDL